MLSFGGLLFLSEKALFWAGKLSSWRRGVLVRSGGEEGIDDGVLELQIRGWSACWGLWRASQASRERQVGG